MTLLITFVVGQLFMFIIVGAMFVVNGKQMRETREAWTKEMGEIKKYFNLENVESIRLKNGKR